MNLLDLPNVMLIQIFEYLSYEEIAKCRAVCRKINEVCQLVLNCGFNKVVRQHAISFKRIKAMLPRRESERRNHCLARHADILTSIETRISMLSMTYCKYMDLNICCFIPGRVLDEINRILRLVTKTHKPLRPHEVLQELRDISSMAIEHFDEKIASTLKKNYTESLQQNGRSNLECLDKGLPTSSKVSTIFGFPSSSPSSSSIWSPTTASDRCCDSIRQKVNTLLNLGQIGIPEILTKPPPTTIDLNGGIELRGCPEARAAMCLIRKFDAESKKGRSKVSRLRYDLTCQTRRLAQAYSIIGEMKSRIEELRKRIDEVDMKGQEMSVNLKHINVGDSSDGTPVAAVSSKGIIAASSLSDTNAQEFTTNGTVNFSGNPTNIADPSSIIENGSHGKEAVKITLKRSTRKRRGGGAEITYISATTTTTPNSESSSASKRSKI